ncbi:MULTISPECIES: MFS transporter [unclassified Pantoea]|uniref:MFS transporter n=1 Tax=unclassified Pantoea TaxID=2630326 RepID=UPI0024775149|nr:MULTISPECIES: MFS transporter [unclassified Pantoea]GME37214.1 MFS transporter [Pantoea sp. QMID3]GME38860.1 MFS transporter [Pantoea sp. QMID1]GME52523.1 MFS transporter [Pantoea sp. QMID4]GME54704.1 MFS transporter [Pantoea sp. QMID2]
MGFMASTAEESLWRHRTFVAFWLARTCSSFGFQMFSVAISWQIYALTNSAMALGMIGLMQFLPSVLLALPAGHLADQYDRRRIVLLGQLVEFAALVALVVLTLFHTADKTALWGLVFMIAVAKALEWPAMSSMLPSLVPSSILARAMAMNSVGGQAAVIVGPTMGGLLYVAGPHVVYGVSGLFYLISLTLVSLLRYERPVQTRLPMNMKNLFAGIHFIRERKDVLGVISLDLFAVLLGGATALLPIFAKDILHTGPWGLGMLRGAPSVGALLVGIWLSRHKLDKHVGMIMFGSVAGFGVATLVFALSTQLWLSLIALCALGGFDMVSMVIRGALVQLDTPDAMRGRVNAVNAIFINTSNQLGEFESGLLAAWMGAAPAAAIGGIGTLIVVALWMKLFPHLRRRQKLENEGDPV